MNEPLISVVIPIYNVENYLEECVDSVLNQNYKNIVMVLLIIALQYVTNMRRKIEELKLFIRKMEGYRMLGIVG